MPFPFHPSIIRMAAHARTRALAMALACVLLALVGLGAAGQATARVMPGDDICSSADRDRPPGDATHRGHCSLCAGSTGLAPPPFGLPLPAPLQPVIEASCAGPSLHAISAGAHWQSRAPPMR